MKNRVLLLAAFMACGIVHAQTDTVHIGDPWYLYNEYKHLEYSSERPTISLPNMFVHYSLPDGNTTVYGVAYTCYNFPFNRDVPLPTFSLYRETSTAFPPSIGIVDTARTDEYIRECRFVYDFGDEATPSSLVAPCHEFYFDTPHPLGDLTESFWISRYWSHDNSWAYIVSLGNNIDSTNWYGELGGQLPAAELAAYKMIYMSSLVDTINIPNNILYPNNMWGIMFPIVRLRCATPAVRLEGADAHSVSVSWSTVEQPEEYQVALAPAGADPSEGTVVTLPDTILGYTFSGVDSAGDYEIRVRKGCRYRTSSYDTIAYSDWSEPVGFQVVGIGEVAEGLTFGLRPNPARGSVEVTLGRPLGAETTLTISDIGGRELSCLTLPAGSRSHVLDIGDLPTGIYILKLVTQNGLAVRRLLKE